MSFGTLTWNMSQSASIKSLTKQQLEFLPRATRNEIQQARNKILKLGQNDYNQPGGYSVAGSEKYATQNDGCDIYL